MNITIVFVYVGPYQSSLRGHWLPGDSDERRRILTKESRMADTDRIVPRWRGSMHDALRALVPAVRPNAVVINAGLQLDAPLTSASLAAINTTLTKATAAAARHANGAIAPFTTVWKTLGQTDWSFRAFLAMRNVYRGLARASRGLDPAAFGPLPTRVCPQRLSDARQKVGGSRPRAAGANTSNETAFALPYFDKVLDAMGATRNVTPSEIWDSVLGGCSARCTGVHLASRGNNLLNLALLRLLWPTWQRVGGRDAPPRGAPVHCRRRALAGDDATRRVVTGVATLAPPAAQGWPSLLVCERRTSASGSADS